MYYLKTKEFKYLVLSYGRDDDDPFYFRIFKHKKSPFFKRYSKVIESTLWGRRLVIEF